MEFFRRRSGERKGAVTREDQIKRLGNKGTQSYLTLRSAEAPVGAGGYRQNNRFVPTDIPEARMPVDRDPTPYEQVAYSAVARVIADRLGRTGLSDPQNGLCIDNSWSDSDVIDATLGVMSSLDKAGYTIVPKPEQERER